MQQRTGSGRFGHSHTGSLGSGSDWGSGSYTPRSTGGGELSQPGSARTTGDSIPGTGVQFGTPRSSTRKPVTGGLHVACFRYALHALMLKYGLDLHEQVRKPVSACTILHALLMMRML